MMILSFGGKEQTASVIVSSILFISFNGRLVLLRTLERYQLRSVKSQHDGRDQDQLNDDPGDRVQNVL